MKRYFSMVVSFAMVTICLMCPVMAIESIDTAESMLEIGGVYIPTTAESTQDGTATVFYNFYDSVNDMHYAFYNVETGEHFALSGPRYEDSSNARSSKIVAHYYSFSGRYTIDGKFNDKTFTLPADNVYLTGDAEIKSSKDNSIVTDEYEDGFTYTIEVRQDRFWFPQVETFTGTAGSGISGEFTAKGDTYYLVINPSEFVTGRDYIEGDGKLFYYA